MSHKAPSQLRISLLLAGSLVAGMLASALPDPREAVRSDEPVLLIEQSLVAESP